MPRPVNPPVLRHVANLWTLMQHPAPECEWSLDRKLAAMREAGFEGVTWGPVPGLREGLERHGLLFLGGLASDDPRQFPSLLADLEATGAHHISIQMGSADTLPPEALGQAMVLIAESRKLGLVPAIETHRGTCTETPEKTYAIADAYHRVTGERLPLTVDLSHFAVVKHLTADQFVPRLLQRPDLIQRAQQFHLRPFNGHHCQVPVTDGRGNLTKEFHDWLPFAEALLSCWLEGNHATGREILVCPEMGPVAGGYNLSSLPNSWEEAGVLRGEIDRLWRKLTRTAG